MSRRLWLVLAIVVVAGLLTTAALLMRDGAAGSGDAARTPSGLDASGDTVDGEGSQGGSSAEESATPGSDALAKPGDQVPDGTAYELIDALRNAGIKPVMGEAVTLEYVERLDSVRVSGKFESSEATSYVLGFDGGVWKVEK